MDQAEQALTKIRLAGESHMYFDQMISMENNEGRAMVTDAMSALTLLALSISDAASAIAKH